MLHAFIALLLSVGFVAHVLFAAKVFDNGVFLEARNVEPRAGREIHDAAPGTLLMPHGQADRILISARPPACLRSTGRAIAADPRGVLSQKL